VVKEFAIVAAAVCNFITCGTALMQEFVGSFAKVRAHCLPSR